MNTYTITVIIGPHPQSWEFAEALMNEIRYYAEETEFENIPIDIRGKQS